MDAAAEQTAASLVEQGDELLRREDPVAFGHELVDLLPVRVVGEHHTDAIAACRTVTSGSARQSVRIRSTMSSGTATGALT